MFFRLLSYVDSAPVFGVLCATCRLVEAFGAALIITASASIVDNLYRSQFIVIDVSIPLTQLEHLH